MPNRVDISQIKRSFTFGEYIKLLGRLVEEKGTTGIEQSEQRVQFTKLNFQRIKRVTKTLHLAPEIRVRMAEIISDMHWMVVVESWCGDVPQNLPYFHAISELSEKVTLSVILRDENPAIMDQFLTNGTRSIPKMICLEPATGVVAGTWGPRPAGAKELVQSMLNNPDISKEKRSEAVQRWYLEDKGQQLQAELYAQIAEWDEIFIQQKRIDIEHLSSKRG